MNRDEKQEENDGRHLSDTFQLSSNQIKRSKEQHIGRVLPVFLFLSRSTGFIWISSIGAIGSS